MKVAASGIVNFMRCCCTVDEMVMTTVLALFIPCCGGAAVNARIQCFIHIPGAKTSGVDCNQVGAGPNLNNAARLRLDIPGATKARGLCLGLNAQGDGLAAKLATWIDTDTGAIREGAPFCDRPKFGKDGHLTRGEGEWKQDGQGYLVLGVHNGNGKSTNPWCGIGGTVPVVLVGVEWRVAKWALPFIKARKVVQRNTDIQRHGRVPKRKAKT